jgi:hypothetical protein
MSRLIPIRELPDLLPRKRGKKFCLRTIYRWINAGARGKRLEAVRIGGDLFVDPKALDEFLGAASPTYVAPQERVKRAERKLHRAGF